MTNITPPIPVTVLTGYLGAGKTTLLNRILSEKHGKKYAVIVNEFGEVGIDNDLIIEADEEIYEMSNGCVCCTIRGDLIRVIGGLVRRSGRFDGILVETTGLADPAPVAQTFFTDRDIAAKTKLDSVITLVDAYHVCEQLKNSPEVEQQIAFADCLVLNKIDLVEAADIEGIKHLLHTLNPFARILAAERSEVKLEDILGFGGFDLNKILELTPDFLTAEEEEAAASEGHVHGDGCGCASCSSAAHENPRFRHDTAISSVSLTTEKPLDGDKIQNWISELSATKGPDLLRYKGIFSFDGEDKRIVIQGVHMMIEGTVLAPWPEGAQRYSRLVLIGRNLDPQRLRVEFLACVKR
ncbi:MAG: GTP-binding protein [Alphaproteobacteria bacterium]|nr:GTP-binding protein [Alphaproteobacteria bacterium]